MRYLLFTLVLFCNLQHAVAQKDNSQLKLKEGIALLNNNNTDSAEILFAEAANEAAQSKNDSIFVKAKTNIGRIYADKGDNVKALGLYHEALGKAESIQDKTSQAAILKNIGALYISWKKFDDALDYYDKAEHLAKEVNNEVLVADCQNNKGTVYEQQKDFDKALTAYKNALDVYTQKDIPAKISMALSNVAIVYKFQKNYEESLKYNFKAIALSEKVGDKWMMAATCNNIGNLYGEMGQYENAIKYCEKALAIAKEISALEIIESIYDSMAEAAAKAGDYKNAYAYRKQLSEAMDKFLNIENTRQLSELSVKFETEKKQKLIQQQQFEISKKNYWLLISSLALAFLAIAGYFIYRNYKYGQDKKLQAEILKQQDLAAKALFEGEQNERIRIARDLHDGVGQMLSLVKMNISSFDTQDPATEKTLTLVDKTIDEVRNVSHNLLPEELNFGLCPALESLAEKVNTSGNIKMEVEIPEAVKEQKFAKQNELSIYRIVQEVVNNMVKHANASLIRLSIQKNNQTILISIEDNGRGLDPDAIKNSKGIGWKNINARVHLLDGEMKVLSEKLSGTQIKITIPG